jgi:hypothetical protein
MKSVMQEASTVIKAIEQGWVKAGQPHEFSVKILEEPQRNFIGITIRSAKIALYFDERIFAKSLSPNIPHKQKVAPSAVREPIKKPAPVTKEVQEQPERTSIAPEIMPAAAGSARNISKRPVSTGQVQKLWSEEMLQYAKEWLSDILAHFDHANTSYKIESQGSQLRVLLNGPLGKDAHSQKQIFASLATLLVESLKRHLKSGLKGYKIVFVVEKAED